MLLIESKVQAVLTQDQLARHERTLRRRVLGTFAECSDQRQRECRGNDRPHVVWIVRVLGSNGTRSEWAERLRGYLRAAEVRLAREDYLTEGTLTMFDGFRFSADNPYTYGEAKRLLNLAMTELRKDKSLQRLGMDPLLRDGARSQAAVGRLSGTFCRWQTGLKKSHSRTILTSPWRSTRTSSKLPSRFPMAWLERCGNGSPTWAIKG